ncbi:MAG: helix-turn-helix domain-containing protein [Nocardioides sp.]|uniref:helix-turn-helix domain-containing protein n=1 Tax=Nocardioides sp. TaxID=35761 RepID=UPI002391CA73|nr:helix-turn-helix domain-containing protein [Nocardioides sp.]MDE0778207.1 helix-turn-helix domain-containing protein [Nocardioides sp.]
MTRQWRTTVPLPGGGVYLSQDAAKMVLFLLRYYAAANAGRNGLTEVTAGSELARELREACEVAARGVSGSGQVQRTSAAPEPILSHRPDDLLTMAQTAEELSVTDRTARRLAAAGDLGTVTHGGRTKLVRRFEVDAYRNRSRSTP